MFPLGFLERKLIGQWIQGCYWPVARVCNVPVRETLIGETNWPVATNCGFKLYLTSNTHTEQRQPRSMAEGLGSGGVKECKGFSPSSVPTTNAASPRVPLGSLVSNVWEGKEYCHNPRKLPSVTPYYRLCYAVGHTPLTSVF